MADSASASTPPPGAVDNGDGTYSYVDPDGLQIGDPMTIGPVTYQYAGQVKYSYAPEPPGPTVVVEPSGWVDHAPRAVILSGMHNDALGRKWNPVDVDNGLLLASVQDWEVEHGIDWAPTTSLPASDLVYEQGDTYQFEWTTYRRPECTNGVDLPPYWIFDSDARTVASSFNPGTWLEWQRQVVYVQWWQDSVEGSGSSCHGTMVHPEWVLTAAHCVWDRIADEPVDTSNPDIFVRVYSHGGDLMAAALERTVTEIHPGPLRGAWAPHRDYALVRLSAPLSHTGCMRLSADTEVQVRDQYMIHAATFPAHSNIPWVNGPTTCTDNSGANPISERNRWWSAKPGWETLSEPSSVTRSRVRTVFNVQRGESGSPWFRCHGATGSCETSERAYQTSLASGFNTFTQRYVGPFVPRFRAWAIACMRDGAC